MPFTSSPSTTPFLDKNGRVSEPWQRWFDLVFTQAVEDIAQLVQNPIPPDQTGALLQAIADLQTQIDLLPGPGEPLALAVAELQTQLAALGDPPRYDAAIAELQMLVGGLLEMPRYELVIADLQTQIGLLQDAPRYDAAIADLQMRIASVVDGSPAAASAIVCNSHANRVNYSAAYYSLYIETDTTLVYASVSGVWTYISGQYTIAQGSIAAYAATLVAADIGTVISVSAYMHQLTWAGANFNWSPFDDGSCRIEMFLIAPTKAGWHACNGTSVSYLMGTGATSTVTLPNFAGTTEFIQLGGALSGPTTINAASGSGFSISSQVLLAYFRQ